LPSSRTQTVRGAAHAGRSASTDAPMKRHSASRYRARAAVLDSAAELRKLPVAAAYSAKIDARPSSLLKGEPSRPISASMLTQHTRYVC